MPKQIVPRKDAFFGVHFDLHPHRLDSELGADASLDNIAQFLDRVKPDYVQYDCKGHAGYTGYPTRVGWASPGIVKDALALWRQATADRGVGLFVHYSGVWDIAAIEHHPEWARRGPDGAIDLNHTSVFGPYVDQLLIPQLCEAAADYDLDGAWVDGECWGAQLDWSPAALEAWEAETGRADAPKQRGDPHWEEWKAFHRRAFERYLAHWTGEVRKRVPRMQLTSNWMYTTFAPKAPAVELDFLSGDYSPMLSVDRGRVEARYLASTGMPWDLMAWGFNWGQELGQSLKSALHLQQEAGAVLMAGGGFQVYYQPTRRGYVVPEIAETMAAVGEFCRARQQVSHKSTTVPQVALLYSSESQFERSDAVFTPYGCVDEIEGALHALLELHYSVDILAEHQLEPRLSEFPLVVLADSHKLGASFVERLTEYVRCGGSLLLLGDKCARLFEPILGVTLDGDHRAVDAELATPLGIANANGVWQPVTATSASVVAMRHPTRDARTGGEPAATVNEYGAGKVAAIFGPAPLVYFRSHQPGLRALIGDLVGRLFRDPAVAVDGPPCVDMALRRTADGRLSVHLLNLAGVQRADRFLHTDFIPAVGPLTVTVRASARPNRVAWEPDGTDLQWTWEAGKTVVIVPSLHIHGAIVLD